MTPPRQSRRQFPVGYVLKAADQTELSAQATTIYGTHGGGGVKIKWVGNKMHVVIDNEGLDHEGPATAMLCRNIGTVRLNPFDACQLTRHIPEQTAETDVPYEGTFVTKRDVPDSVPDEHATLGMDISIKTTTCGECLLPRFSMYGRWGVVCDPKGIEPGDVGPVWTDGDVLARLWYWEGFNVPRQYTDWTMPDRCGTMKDAPYLQALQAGAGQILWLAYPEIQTETPRLALIRMDHRNTDGVGIVPEDEDDNNNGIAEVIELPEGFEVVSGDGAHSDGALSHGIILIRRIQESV